MQDGARAALERRLRADVAALARPEGRVCGSAGHARARSWLVERLAAMELEPYSGSSFELPYERGGARFVNLLARLPGAAPAGERGAPLLLAAHYDTCGVQPGADDNAAAIAAALAAAELLKAAPVACDLVLAFFDAEEPPHFLTPAMGSIRFYEDQRRDDFRCAVVMDLVGHDLALPGLEDLLVVTGAEALAEPGPPPRPLFESLPEPEGLRLLPVRNESIGDMSDHHAFRVAGAPYLFLTCGEWEHYHTPGDTAERVAYGRLARTAGYLATLARWLSTRALVALEVEERVEVERFAGVAGPALARLGLPLPLQRAADVRRVVELLRSRL